MSSKLWAVLAVALSVPMLQACGDSDDADVRLINATTDYSSLSLYQSTTAVGDAVASDSAGNYSGLGADTYTFNVRSTGSSSNASSVSQAVTKKTHYSLVSYVTGGALTTTVLTEDEDTPDSGYAKLRIFNAASSEVAGVDVYVTSNACSSLTSSDTAVATDVTGLGDSYNEVVAASSGTSWHMCVVGTGDKTDLRLDIPAVTLTSKQITTLILTKSTGGYLLNGLLLDQKGSMTSYANPDIRLRVVSDAASSGTVSVTANNVTLASSATATVGAYKLVTAGDLTTSVSINGTAVTETGLTGTSGGDYTLLVAGTAASPSITLLTDDSTPSTSTSLPVKMRLVNGLNGSSATATLTSDGVVAGDSVAFGAASSYANIAASSGAASVQVTSSGSTLWSVSSQTLSSGNVYTVFLLGDSGAATGVLRVDN